MHQGFSLVELSIVLVILGLLIGGVLTGQTLIHAAELRQVSTEYSRYITAVQTFRGKYFALPGDMANATVFWGAAHATPTTCKTTPPTGTQTCNGDGNSQVDDVSISYEGLQAWRQLVNAGMLEGTYTGQAGACGSPCPTPGVNTPASKLGRAGWHFEFVPPVIVDGSRYVGNYGNIFYFGEASADYGDRAAIKAEDAWNIDTKLDDGRPAYGRLKATMQRFVLVVQAAIRLPSRNTA